MLHEEFFFDHLDDLKKSLGQLPGTSEYNIKMLDLIVKMKIANSLEIIADSLGSEQYQDGIAQTLSYIQSTLSIINSKS